jgi:hypothetical protein
MIAANELRIGNWVSKEGELFKVTSYTFLIIERGETLIEPIPLTPEILEKCGFVKQMMWTYAIDIVGNMKLVYYLGEKGWSIGNKNYSDFSNLNYLHQLQNLYFSLTGTELNYTP